MVYKSILVLRYIWFLACRSTQPLGMMSYHIFLNILIWLVPFLLDVGRYYRSSVNSVIPNDSMDLDSKMSFHLLFYIQWKCKDRHSQDPNWTTQPNLERKDGGLHRYFFGRIPIRYVGSVGLRLKDYLCHVILHISLGPSWTSPFFFFFDSLTVCCIWWYHGIFGILIKWKEDLPRGLSVRLLRGR